MRHRHPANRKENWGAARKVPENNLQASPRNRAGGVDIFSGLSICSILSDACLMRKQAFEKNGGDDAGWTVTGEVPGRVRAGWEAGAGGTHRREAGVSRHSGRFPFAGRSVIALAIPAAPRAGRRIATVPRKKGIQRSHGNRITAGLPGESVPGVFTGEAVRILICPSASSR